MSYYKAPWCTFLLVVSSLVTLLCLGIPIISLTRGGGVSGWGVLVLSIPALLIPACALFVVRSYTITPDVILIERLFWSSYLSREGLQSARVEPGALNKSIRICGNGGFYSFTGFYWSKKLGRYRVYVTDLSKTVVLQFESRTVVVSPDNPEAFVRDLS